MTDLFVDLNVNDDDDDNNNDDDDDDDDNLSVEVFGMTVIIGDTINHSTEYTDWLKGSRPGGF